MRHGQPHWVKPTAASDPDDLELPEVAEEVSEPTSSKTKIPRLASKEAEASSPASNASETPSQTRSTCFVATPKRKAETSPTTERRLPFYQTHF